MPSPIRVLMLSKACLVGEYQRKLEAIATHPDIDLTVVVPPRWRDERGTLYLERAHTEGYRLLVEPIVLSDGLPLHPDSDLAHKFDFHLHFYPRLGRRLTEFRPDVIHIDEEPYNFAAFHALVLARRCRAKAIFFSWQNLLRRYPMPFNWMERYVLRHSDYAICGNRAGVDVWRAKGFTGPATVIPQFGVDLEATALAPRNGRGPSAGSGRGFVIAYLGRLVPEKGVDLLLHACARLEGVYRLEIVGSGPERENLERLAHKLGLHDRVTFEGWLPSAKMPVLLSHMDVVVLPSRSLPNWQEQFGRVLIEAMACGVPVIGSTCGEIPNVIGEAGLTFPEGDIEALADRLRRVMRDSELASHLLALGRVRVREHFSQDKIAAETVAVYRAVVSH